MSYYEYIWSGNFLSDNYVYSVEEIFDGFFGYPIVLCTVNISEWTNRFIGICQVDLYLQQYMFLDVLYDEIFDHIFCSNICLS